MPTTFRTIYLICNNFRTYCAVYACIFLTAIAIVSGLFFTGYVSKQCVIEVVSAFLLSLYPLNLLYKKLCDNIDNHLDIQKQCPDVYELYVKYHTLLPDLNSSNYVTYEMKLTETITIIGMHIKIPRCSPIDSICAICTEKERERCERLLDSLVHFYNNPNTLTNVITQA